MKNQWIGVGEFVLVGAVLPMKAMAPIARKTETPPMVPPAIAPACEFDCDLGEVPVALGLTVIWRTGALKWQVRHRKGRMLSTNLRANGAYIAPCAGLEADADI